MAFNLKGLLEDENFLIGAGLLTAGAKGQSAGEAIFPSIIQAAKVKKTFQDTAKPTKSVYSVSKGENILATDKMVKEDRESGNNDLQPAKKTDNSKLTISDEVLAVYSKLTVAKNDQEFKQIFDSLSKAEQALYNNKILGNVDVIEQAVADKIENTVTLDVEQMAAISEYKLGKKVEGYDSVQEVVETQMANNPDAPFDQILESLIQARIIEK